MAIASTVLAQTADERLFEAIQDGKPLVAEGLIANGQASPRARDANGETALHRAVEKGLRELTVLLLRSGANPAARSNSGETALHLAALHADAWFAEQLLAWKADPRARNDDGETPLHWAALSGNAATARLLLLRGADANISDIRGNLPLHGAADGGDPATVRLLLERTDNRDAKNREGLAAADLARARGYGELTALLGGNAPRTERADRPADRRPQEEPPKQGFRSMDIDDPNHPRKEEQHDR